MPEGTSNSQVVQPGECFRTDGRMDRVDVITSTTNVGGNNIFNKGSSLIINTFPYEQNGQKLFYHPFHPIFYEQEYISR